VARFQSKVLFLIVCDIYVWHVKMSGDMTYVKNLPLTEIVAPINNIDGNTVAHTFVRVALFNK
jgi:hypothetical protein